MRTVTEPLITCTSHPTNWGTSCICLRSIIGRYSSECICSWSRTLTLQQNCVSLDTTYITTSPTRNGNIYYIEFTNYATVGGIYIGEVIFRDQVIQNPVCKSIEVMSNCMPIRLCILNTKIYFNCTNRICNQKHIMSMFS